MSTEQGHSLDAITQRVKASLTKAETTASRLRKTNTILLVSAIVCSAVSTLIAAITASQGPVIGTGIEGWRVSCIVAAVFAFVSTLTTGLTQQLKIADRLSGGTQCLGRLRSLDLSLATGSHSWEEVVTEYEEIVRSYPEIVC